MDKEKENKSAEIEEGKTEVVIKEPTDYEIKDSGERTEFKTGAVRDIQTGKGRFDLIPWAVIRALAIHYEKGAVKYGDNNWKKGIPISRFLDSATRHLACVIDGKDDENHLISAIWNLVGAYWTILQIQNGKLPKELYDLEDKVILPNPYVQK